MKRPKRELPTQTRVEALFAQTEGAAGFVRGYFDYLSEILQGVDTAAIEAVVDKLLEARSSGARVFILGNGGSAATASHFANDLAVGISGELPFDAVSLVANVPVLTAVANDHGYAEVFVRQVSGRIGPGDLMIALSASGRSENVLRAVRYASGQGASTVGFTGFDGGELRRLVDIAVHIPSLPGEYEPTEDAHLACEHAIASYLRLRCRAGGLNVHVAVCSRSFSRHSDLRAMLRARHSSVRFNEDGRSLAGEELVDFLAGADKAIVGLECIDGLLLDRLPTLKVISKYGVGLDRIALSDLQARGVRLGWTPGVNRRAVAELVIAQAIGLLRGLHIADRQIHAGLWQPRVGRELSSSCIGIIGCGNVGKELARLLQPFGVRILAHDILDFPDFYASHHITPVLLDELLRNADIVTLHVPLDSSTRQILSKERLALMRPGAYLINTARGGLVDEMALVDELRSGRLGGAAIDVFEDEPATESPLASLDAVLCTAHMGGSTEEAVLAMGRAAITGLEHHAPASDYA